MQMIEVECLIRRPSIERESHACRLARSLFMIAGVIQYSAPKLPNSAIAMAASRLSAI